MQRAPDGVDNVAVCVTRMVNSPMLNGKVGLKINVEAKLGLGTIGKRIENLC